MNESPAVLLDDFHKHYGATIAVAGISFSTRAGEILGLLGENGAGKTTILRTIAGILTPTRGRVEICGHDLEKAPIAARSALAYIPDEPRLFESLTVWEHLRFTASAYRVADWRPCAEALLQRFELIEKRDARCSQLSRGMRQKVAICCGYLHMPRVILFDEPLTGLDPRGIRTLEDSIRERAASGDAVIVSSHLLSLVEGLCTSILILHRGRPVLHGQLPELRRQLAAENRSETLEEMFFRLTETPSDSTSRS